MSDEVKDETGQPAFARRPHAGSKPVPGYESEAAALRAKTERLKALRLAREAAMPPAPLKRAAAKKGGAKPTAKSGVRGPSTLSAWLEDQQKSGRRT